MYSFSFFSSLSLSFLWYSLDKTTYHINLNADGDLKIGLRSIQPKEG